MSRYEDLKKKRSTKTEEEKGQGQTSTSRYQRLKENRGERTYGVDDSYINTFVQDAKSFMTSSQEDQKGLSWKSATDKEKTNSRQKTSSDLRSRASTIRAYLNANKSSIDEDTYKELTSYLDNFDSYSGQVFHTFRNAEKYYSQWDSEDDYNSWYAQQKDREQKLSADTGALQKELDDLADYYDEVASLEYQIGFMKHNPGEFTQEERDSLTAKYSELQGKYGSVEGLEKAIQEKELYLAEAKRLQEGARLASVSANADFTENSDYVSTKSDGFWDKLTSQYGLGYDDLTYEYINGADNGMRGEILRKNTIYSSDSLGTAMDWKVYDSMTDDEIAIYNYHYAKNGKKSAEKYLDSIRETLNAREAGVMYANMEDNTLLELAFGVAAGLDQFESGAKGAWNAITGNDEYIPATSTQMASAMVREDLADEKPKVWYNFKKGQWEDQVFGRSAGQAAYDAITTSANMAPSIMTSWALSMVNPVAGSAWVTAGQIAGTGMMGASAAGNAYQEVINLGYDKDQARAYAALVGGSEAGLQYLLGGIGKLGGKLSGNALTKVLNGVDDAFARTALKLGGNMLSEGLEEGLQEVLTPWFQNLVLHTDNEVDWNEVAYSSLLGALTAGFMEGGSTIAGEVNTYKTGKNLQAADISAQRLSELGKTFSADTVAYQLAGRVNENTGAYTLGRLFNEIGATLSEQNISEITNALVAKGMDEVTARKNAKALAYVVEGGQLSEKQIAVIEANDVLAEVARTTLIDANTTWNQRSKGYNEMLKALADEMTSPKTSRTKQAQQGVENAPAADTVDGKNENGTESLSEAESVDTSPAKVSSISSIKDGQATIKLEDDSEVSVKDADLSPDDGVRIETIASIEGISSTDANLILNTLRTSTNASAQMDSLGAKEAYKYGFYGFSQDHMTKHGVFANSLTEHQRQAIYEVGQKARQQQIEKSSLKKTTAKQRGVYFDHGNGNVVAFKDADKSLVSEEKRSVAVQVAVILNKLGIGGDIYFFESYRNSKGQRVYKNSKGEEVKAPNGWYEKGSGSIHIDLNAGKGGNGLVLFTMAHELTHFIEEWSPKKYKILADFLVENYEKGQSMDSLVRAKQAELSRNRGKSVSYGEAYSEVVADSMEAMLADGNVMEKLMELKAKDNDLVVKMKQFFDNLLAKIRNAYKGLTPDSDEGKAVLEMTDSIEKIQQLFAEALVEASENFQSAEVQKNTTKDGGVKEQARQSQKNPDLLDPRTVTKADVLKLLRNVEVGVYDENTYIPVRVSTPGIIQERLFAEDLPMAMPVKKVIQAFKPDLGKIKGKNVRGHGLTVDELIYIIENLDSPDYLFSQKNGRGVAVIKLTGSVDNTAVIVEFGDHINTPYMNGYEGGKYNISITAFDIDDGDAGLFMMQMEKGWTKVFDKQKEGDPAKKFQATRPFAIEQDSLSENVAHAGTDVKHQSSEALDIEVDEDTESVAPTVQMSERTWTESDYVQERETAAKEIAKAIGVSVKKAKAYIDSVNSIAKMIADDRVRLDYFSSPGRSSFVGNVEYGGSFDFSTLCKKRRLLTGTFTAIQKALPNTALTADEILDIRNRMKDAGLEVSCGLCYVEGSRANMGQFAKEFLRLYKQYYPDAWQPNMADVNTPDGIEWVRINHPEVYEQYEYFWNHYGTLKDGDKNLFASQQKPKLYQLHTEYKGEILEKFNDDDNVEEKNLNGGIRLQSFSDFEIVHLIDTMQIIMDMSRVGLAGQAYTKVPDFAWALGDTGLKINLSLIAKGVDENGRLIFDDVEGMPIDKAVELRNRYSKNVGTILVAFNDEQLMAAMADERVDYIIPFHRSQWKKSQYGAMGLPAKTKDYTFMQNEKFIKPQYHEYRGRMVKDKATNYMPNEYWDFSKSGKENAQGYLEMCARNNKRPKFYKLLQNNGDGSYSLKADGSTDGYWKLLIDFKMYDNEGNGSPQMPVKPDFNMDEATRMLNEYSGGHSNFPVAQGVVDSFVEEYKDSHKGVLYQDRADESVSNRSLLANAFEGVAQNEIERNKIREYKEKISLVNAEEQKLNELNEQIKELSFAKGPRDIKKIRDLQFEARQTANRISTYDKMLLRLEASKPLQDVLQREKKMAYKRAEQKGKEALEAYREKTMKTQRELLEKWQESRKKGIDSRQRTAMRHKIKDIVNELNQYLLKGTKDRHVPESLQKAVAEALDAVNMDTVGAEERIAKLKTELLKAKTPEQIQEISRKIDHIQEMGDKMNGRLKKLKDAYDELLKSPDENTRNSYDDVIHNKLDSVIDKIGNTPLRDMTLAQLEDVYDMYRMVLKAIRDVNKSFKDAKNQSISTRANAVMAQVEEVGGKHTESPTILNGIKKFFWNNLKPVYAFEHIGSVTLTEAFKNVRAGEDTWALDVVEARNYYLEKTKQYKYDSWDFQKQYTFESTSGMEFKLNLEQIMSLYAYSKRDQAGDHLKYGGIVFDESTKIIKKTKLGISLEFNPTDATAYNISEETLADITSKLTDEQKAFADEMQDYLSTVMGAKGNEVSMAMYDIKLFKDKNYFPLKSAQQFMEKAREQQKGDVKIKNSGFSKETVPKAKNPIVLTPFMEVWANHVNEMSMYHAFVLPLEDFYRIYNYKTPSNDANLATEGVNQYIQNAYGRGATAYIDQLLKDMNGGAITDSTTGFINKMMGLFKKGSVFASLSVVVQQPSAIARATALVDTKYFIGPKVDHKRHKALWDEVKQYAPVAIIKEMGYFDTNMGKSTQDYILSKEYSGFSEKMKALVTDSGYRDELLSKAPALADEIAWCSIWEAVKREVSAKVHGMDVKSEEFLKLAGERFTEVITKTQVYDSVLSRSGMMRSKDTGMKMATAFMAEPTTSINMIADALLQGKRGRKKYARAAIGAVIASQILNSILVSFVYAGRDDDEDETYLEKYIGTFTAEMLDGLNPATYIPFIKDIVSIVQGYDVERSDMAVVSDLWNAWQNLSKDNVSAYRKVEGFAGSIAQIFGLPVKNIMRDARGIYQTIESFVNGQQTTAAGIGYAVKGAITGKDVSDSQQLYEAYLSGDKDQIARVKGRFKDQNAINNAIRKGLRENDPRIHQAAIAWNANNLDEYMRIAKEIIAEKHFVQDDVVMAIRSEANALAPDAESETKSKAKGMFTAEKFAEAIAQGDQAMANAIKVDIIQTAEKNGKTEEEAEKSFVSSATAACKELFLTGDISESQAVNALETYCDKTEDEAMADVQYWAFKQDNPDVYADDQWFDTYYEKIADSGLDIEVYMEYRNKVSAITGDGKKGRRMAVINSLPITKAQKDALYYAEGWTASKLYEAPWH